MPDDHPNLEAEGYLINLVPPTEPGSAADRAVYDYIRKFGASVDGVQEEASDTRSTRGSTVHDELQSDFSSLGISNTTAPRPRPDLLHTPALRTDNFEVGTSPDSPDSVSDASSPTNALADSVGSVSEPSDTELSPVHTQHASHRIFNMPSYMPLNTGGSTSVGVNAGIQVKTQIFIILMKIDQEIPNDMAAFVTTENSPPFRLLFDPGYSTILTIGSHCQKMAIPDSATLTLPLNPRYYQGFYEEQEGVAHAQIFVHPHSPAGRPIIPATVQLPDVHYGCTKFLGGCSAVVALTKDEQQLQFFNCFQWDASSSWDSQLTISSRIGVAHCVTAGLTLGGTMDGIIGFAPTDRQTIFDIPNPLHAPSVLASLERASQLAIVDNNDGGVVVYCTMRPFALWSVDRTTSSKILKINPYNSWIALNKWPIRLSDRPEESTPMWSGRVKIFELDTKTPTWNVLLLSMKFGIFKPISETWSDIPGGEIVFDGGLVTILDPGCAVSWVPPEVVRCIRTTLFPCLHNQALDMRLRDRPNVMSDFLQPGRQLSDLNYAVELSDTKPQLCKIEYRFSNGVGSAPIVVNAPVDPFICALSPHGKSGRPEYEGLLFVPEPGRIPTKHRAAIFGVNFFQSMFVAFHKPSNRKRRPYVQFAPQWSHEIPRYGPPRHHDDDSD